MTAILNDGWQLAQVSLIISKTGSEAGVSPGVLSDVEQAHRVYDIRPYDMFAVNGVDYAVAEKQRGHCLFS